MLFTDQKDLKSNLIIVELSLGFLALKSFA